MVHLVWDHVGLWRESVHISDRNVTLMWPPHFTFRALKEITDYIHSVANSTGILHPNNVTASIKNLGKTYEGREIQMISMSLEVRMDNSCIIWRLKTSHRRIISFVTPKKGDITRPAILIDCGIHAREWVSVEFCIYVIQQLLTDKSVEILE